MIRLNSSSKIQVTLGGSVTTNELPVVVSYQDNYKVGDADYGIGGTKQSVTKGTAIVDVCLSPPQLTINNSLVNGVRDVDTISIINEDTASATVYVLLYTKPNLVETITELASVTLDVGDELQYTDASAWNVINSAGEIKTSFSGTIIVTGGATSANQTNGSQKTQVVDGSGNVISATANALDINIKSGNPTTIAVTQATATSLKAQAEVYQGGAAVGAANPLQVSLANTGANTNKLLVTPDSVALPANQSVNVAQLAGTTTDTNSGNKSAGTLRTVIATDSPAITQAGFISAKIDQTTDGTTNKVRATGTQKPSYGATVVLAVTALQSLASSATAGWKSVMVSNVAALANDYEVFVKLTTANTSPGSDKAMYVFAIPWYTTDGGSTWFAASGGTATLPTSADAAYTIASPHNFRLLGVLNYTTIQMVVQDTFLLSNAFGSRMPDGFSICIINFSNAALSTGCVVDYTPINDIIV